VQGLRNLASAGATRGARYTLTPDSEPDLDAVLSLVERERVERFCLYHLAPSGRGKYLHDVTPDQRRAALHRLFEFAVTHPEVEVLTVDNPSDGVALARWLEDRDPEAARRCRDALAWNRGAAGGPGVGLAAVDERGDVHPDQFSRHRTVGNVRVTPFSEIWTRADDPYLQALRAKSWSLPAVCRRCSDRGLCNGGLRSRAELSTGDVWGFDPSCSLRAS
jgi:radical SAM protein with 4Fe4S-binding SPASM domain